MSQMITCIPLSDTRTMIRAGSKTYYVRQLRAPVLPGEGWNPWDRTGPPGSEPVDGKYEIDDGEDVVHVEAENAAYAWRMVHR